LDGDPGERDFDDDPGERHFDDDHDTQPDNCHDRRADSGRRDADLQQHVRVLRPRALLRPG
jgi:hypothetical protein